MLISSKRPCKFFPISLFEDALGFHRFYRVLSVLHFFLDGIDEYHRNWAGVSNQHNNDFEYIYNVYISIHFRYVSISDEKCGKKTASKSFQRDGL